jgi:hypothetical protein
MKKNMGKSDKTIRVIIAVFIAILYFTNVINGYLGIALGVFAIILLITSFVSFCPLYKPLNINTSKKKTEN